jgi:Tfp pilus assembly protein PilX
MALITSLLIMLIMIALGFTLVSRVSGERSESKWERTREGSFNLAEAALNAQALQVGRSWPTGSSWPTSCDPSSTSTLCPQATAIANGYTGVDYTTTCKASPTTPAWTTTVRDNVSGEKYWTTAVNSRAQYDANGDGAVWVRSTGVVQCNVVSVVALVSRSVIPMDFPNNVTTSNFITTNNQGKKVLIDTTGAYAQPPSIRPTNPSSQPAGVVARCSGLSTSQCLAYDSTKGQVQPPAVRTDTTASTTALSLTQLDALKRQAIAAGTYWAAGTCPTTAAQLASVSGAPVYVEGSCISMNIQGSGTINSATSPGVLIIADGRITLGGTLMFYGLIYGVNKTNYSGSVVTISGNATIQGVVAVDGLGGITVGSSKTNLIYDPRAPTLLRGDSGAAVNKNTFRVLSSSTQ